MKLKLLLFALLVSVAATSTAQHADIKWGNEAVEKKYNYVPIILGEDEKGLIGVRLKNISAPAVRLMRGGDSKGIASLYLIGYARYRNDSKIMEVESYFKKDIDLFVERYDKNLNLTYQKQVDLSEIKKNKDAESLFKSIQYLDKKIIVFSTHYYKNNKNTIIGWQELSQNAVLSPMKQLGTIPHSKSNKYDKNSVEVATSPDKNRVLIFAHEVEDEKSPKEIHIKVLNKDMSAVYDKSIKLDVSEADMDIEDFLIDNSGQVFVLARIFLEGNEKKESNQKFKYRLYSIKQSEAGAKEIPLKFASDKSIVDIKMLTDATGNLVVTGFYSEKSGSSSYMKGVFLLNFDANTLAETRNNIVEFDKNFITEVIGAKKAEKNSELQDFHVRNIYFNADNSVTFIAEKYFIEVKKQSNSVLASYTFTYNYRDILTFNVSENGTVNWVKNLAKNQKTSNDGAVFSSVLTEMVNGNLYIMYNAYKNDPAKTMYNPKTSFSYISKIDKSGKVSTAPLFSSKEEQVVMTPRINYKTGTEKVLIHNVKGANFRLAELQLK